MIEGTMFNRIVRPLFYNHRMTIMGDVFADKNHVEWYGLLAI